VPLAALQVEAGSKFVDLGADSLDTVSFLRGPLRHLWPHQHWNRAILITLLPTLPVQVEIMMALEEKFDLQMDEEGEPAPSASTRTLRAVVHPWARGREGWQSGNADAEAARLFVD
jgi:acyl carrier protein